MIIRLLVILLLSSCATTAPRTATAILECNDSKCKPVVWPWNPDPDNPNACQGPEDGYNTQTCTEL